MERYDELSERDKRKVLELALEHVDEAVVCADPDGRISFVNRAWEEMTGLSAAEALGQNDLKLLPSGEHRADFWDEIWIHLMQGRVWRGRVVQRRLDGSRLPQNVTIAPMMTAAGRVSTLVSVRRDATEEERTEALIHKAQSRLVYNALHDPLTGLPNRSLFKDRLEQASRRRRRTSSEFAVLFIAMERLQGGTDSLGYAIGHHLIREVGRRIRDCIPPEDTLARLGGAEFAVLAEDAKSPELALVLAERTLAALTIDTDPLRISVNIGVAVSNADIASGRVLVNADHAMCEARAQGGGRCVLFDGARAGFGEQQQSLEGRLRDALDQSDIKPWYQPVVSLLTGAVVSFEALARWGDDVDAPPPSEFIPLAEDTGLIFPLGESVLERACAFLVDSPLPIRVGVNVSARQFLRSGLVDQVRGILEDAGVDPKRLELEIAESTAMHDPEATMEVCRGLQALGVSITIDDFGTGSSSLSWLHRLSVQTVKIDRTFVANLSTPEGKAIVGTILTVADLLGLRVVAAGVETEEQRKELVEMGCEWGQGWLFSPPLTDDAALLFSR